MNRVHSVTEPMSKKAKLFVAFTLAAGLAVLEMAIFHWPAPNLPRFFVFLMAGLIAATRKVRLPGLTGTMSASFFFVLIGIADYSFSETVLMGCLAALMQSAWKAKQRPKAVQVAFNAASWAVSAGVSFSASHFILAAARTNSLPILLALASCFFFLTHTGFLATVLSLTNEQSFREVWQQCLAWSFPYYLVGTAIAGLVSASSRSLGWQVSFLILPVMYLVYLHYRFQVERAARQNA